MQQIGPKIVKYNTNMVKPQIIMCDNGGGGGGCEAPKMHDIIFEQPLMPFICKNVKNVNYY